MAGFLAAQMRAGADADPFFFAADGDMSDVFVFVKQIDELHHIDIGNARYEVDAGFFQSCENLLRSRDGSHIANPSKVRRRALRVPASVCFNASSF